MWIESLQLERFRCFEQQSLDLQPGLNLLHGDNGSGKSSLLEAVSLLLHKRSFRTARTSQVIADGHNETLIQSQLVKGERHHRAAMQISRSGQQHVLDQEHDVSRVLLQTQFPLFIMDPVSANALIQEPEARRRWADRAMFHVKPDFIKVWQKFQRSLRQRNASLGQGGAEQEVWTRQFLQCAASLDQHRQAFIAEILPLVNELLAEMASELLPPLRLEYRQGWRAECSLDEELERSRASESKMGFTMVGPHRADLVIRTDGGLARERLSRGQIKVLALCLSLAQLRYATGNDNPAVFLWDDWFSELAEPTQKMALQALMRLQLQTVLTAPSQKWPDGVPMPGQMFHVKH